MFLVLLVCAGFGAQRVLSAPTAAIATRVFGVRDTAPRALYAERDGTFRFVERMRGSTPQVRIGDKLVAASETRFVLNTTDRFALPFVTVTDYKVTVSNNRDLSYKADLRFAYSLKNVFLVFEMNRGELIAREVGDMEPGQWESISEHLIVDNLPDSTRFTVHVFSNGKEVLNSTLNDETIRHAYERAIADKIARAANSAPMALVGPQPIYPPKLRSSHVKGSATVAFRISTTGVVENLMITAQTDNAFGAAALTAISERHFAPKIVNGQRVESRADITFPFDPGK